MDRPTIRIVLNWISVLFVAATVCYAEMNDVGKARSLTPYRIDSNTDGDVSVMDSTIFSNCVLWQAFSYCDNSGMNYYDISAGENDGMQTNVNARPAWSTTNGGCVTFDSVDDYIEITDSSGLDGIFNNGGTVSAWIYAFSDGEQDAGKIINRRGFGYFLDVRDEAGGMVRPCFLRDFDDADGWWKTSDLTVEINKWQHIAVTYDESSVTNDAIIYINGEAVAITEGATPIGSAEPETTTLFIGNSIDSTKTFDGLIDELLLFNDALTASEVTNLYDKTKGRYQP